VYRRRLIKCEAAAARESVPRMPALSMSILRVARRMVTTTPFMANRVRSKVRCLQFDLSLLVGIAAKRPICEIRKRRMLATSDKPQTPSPLKGAEQTARTTRGLPVRSSAK